MSGWYVRDARGDELGPTSWDAIRQSYKARELTLDSLVMHADHTDGAWRPLREVNETMKGPRVLGHGEESRSYSTHPIAVATRIERRWPGCKRRRSALNFWADMCGVSAILAGLGTCGLAAENAAMIVAIPFAIVPWMVARSAMKVLSDIYTASLTQETLLQEDREHRQSRET